jgi:DNA excision repair protein ERCC-6
MRKVPYLLHHFYFYYYFLDGSSYDGGGYEKLNEGLKIPKSLWSRLYNYQRVGVQWMFELHQQKCGGILGR